MGAWCNAAAQHWQVDTMLQNRCNQRDFKAKMDNQP
jgi:hypothetical protein